MVGSATLPRLVLAITLAVAGAAAVTVTVGKRGDQFAPLSVRAEKGATVDFVFSKSSHNLVQSAGYSLALACQAVPGGLHTSLRPKGSTYHLHVNSSEAIYLHSESQCKSEGMVFVINPPNTSVVEQFKANALGSNTQTSGSGSPLGSRVGFSTTNATAPTFGDTLAINRSAVGSSSGSGNSGSTIVPGGPPKATTTTTTNGSSTAVTAPALPISTLLLAAAIAVLFACDCAI